MNNKTIIMKKIILLCLYLLFIVNVRAQISIRQSATDIQLPRIINANTAVKSVKDLNGKVIWIEFWATYCGPCVDAMPRLQALQKQFKGKLQVIAISTEKEKRVRQYLINKPSDLWFAVDTDNLFEKVFPYRVIPQSVLIDKTGKVVAITDPENITAEVIKNVLAGKNIDLPVKADNMTTDPVKTYFNADASVKSRFVMQPEINGLSSMSKTYPQYSAFKNRRISVINLSLQAIYRLAYRDMPYGRVIDLTEKANVKQKRINYCLDLIVPHGHESKLYETLIKELQSRFDLEASVEKRAKPVYVLKISDTTKISQLTMSKNQQRGITATHGSFDGQNIKITEIANYLEGFGLVKMPVVDETGLQKRYDITFEYQPEKDGSLTEALNKLGFKLEPAEREINMLVFREK